MPSLESPGLFSPMASGLSPLADRASMLEIMAKGIEADIKQEMKQKRREAKLANEAALSRMQADAKTVVQQRRSKLEESVHERLANGGSPAALIITRSNASPSSANNAASADADERSYHHLLHMEGMVRKMEREKWRDEALGVLEAQQLSQCTFAPTINAKSRALVASARSYTPDGGKRLDERMPEILAEQRHRRQHLEAQVHAARQAEMERERPPAPPKTPSSARPASAASPQRTPRSGGGSGSGTTPKSGGDSSSKGSGGSSKGSSVDDHFLEAVERQAQKRRFRMQMLRSNINFERSKVSETFEPKLNFTTERLAAKWDEENKDEDMPLHERLHRTSTTSYQNSTVRSKRADNPVFAKHGGAGGAVRRPQPAPDRRNRRPASANAGGKRGDNTMTLSERIAAMAEHIGDGVPID